MDRLGLVAAPGGRPWRVYAAPAAFLLAATIAIGLLRGDLRGRTHPAAAKRPPAAAHAKAHRHRVYVVRAGDTIEAISTRTSVPQAKILALNPKVSPTALFIGEKLRLP
jgi:spore germination protein YaaH